MRNRNELPGELELVFVRFQLLTQLDEAEAADWKVLCQDAWLHILSQKRDHEKELTADEESRLIAAAAALAFYQYVLIAGASGGEEVSLGDMKVSQKSGNLAYARTLWEDARGRAAALLCDDGFYFEHTGGERDEAGG